MKLFKGEMSLWKQLTDARLMNGPGGLMDISSYRAPISCVVMGIFIYFLFWNMDAMAANFNVWLKDPIHWLIADPAQILTADMRRHHFYAKFWLGLCLLAAALGFYSIWSSRRRARKSAEGQWYDKPGLTKQDLYGKPRKGGDS